MNKRIFSILLVVVLLLSCFCITTSAAQETDAVKILNCDVAFGSFVTNAVQKTEGRASFQLPLADGGFKFANATTLAPVKDVSNKDTLAFDMYVSDPERILASFAELVIELTSSGTCDNGEIAFFLQGDLKDMAKSMKPGWNTVHVYFEAVNYTSNPDPVDLTKINYIRIFGTNAGGAGLSRETLLIDNFRVCNTGGPSFEDLEHLEQFRGDNSDVTVEIDGMEMPDENNRHNEVTIKEGEKLDEADKVVLGDSTLIQPSISVNPDEQPTGGGYVADEDDATDTEGESNVGDADDGDVTVNVDSGASSGSSLKLVIVICCAVLVLAVAVLMLVVVVIKTKKKDA